MIEDLLHGNAQWATEKVAEKADYFTHLAALQKPEYLWIGCSDSRVPANVITGLEPGEIFVHRNVANMIHSSDMNLLSVLAFAVRSLQVKHIIVCGHYGCGGVHGALGAKRHDIVDYWLQPIRELAVLETSELDMTQDAEQRARRLCELNVMSQIESLSRTAVVQSAWNDGLEFALHGWIYDLNDGLLRVLVADKNGMN